MAQGSGNVSNIVSFGGIDGDSNLTIPEANSQGYFSLNSGNGSAGGNYTPFYKNGILYQVTSGKTCVVVHIIYTATASNSTLQLVHSLTTFAINASSIISGVYEGGAASSYVHSAPTGFFAAGYSTPYSFPSLSFPGNQSSATGFVTLICKEV